jgi:O-antigen/teichoic acid export membrane protein
MLTAETNLTAGRLLLRNMLWNLASQAAPLLVAIVAIPLLIQRLGTDRFGILTLAWVVVGYFSLFDLGLGRALTQLVAKNLGMDGAAELGSLVWTSLFLMILLGLLGTVLTVLVAPLFVYKALRIPAALQPETLQSLYLLAASVPLVITSAGLRGVLEANQLFAWSSAVRTPLGIATFGGPLLVLPFTRSLLYVVLTLVLARLGALISYAVLCFRLVPGMHPRPPTGSLSLQLLRFGGWMTVSNLVSPIMVYMDRVLIGALISVTAVAYYATPYEVVTKLWVIPGAVGGVLFPAFATSFVGDPGRTLVLFDRGVKYVFLSVFPVALLIVSFADVGLRAWLGTGFALHSTSVLRWLCVGVFVNSLGQIAFSLLQGVGRPDLTAKLHLAELPCYLPLLLLLLYSRGIEGAAIAWTIRVTADMLILFALAFRLTSARASRSTQVLLGWITSMACLAIVSVPTTLPAKLALVFVILCAFAAAGWFKILSPEERAVGRRLASVSLTR